jgi:hypothetical protein
LLLLPTPDGAIVLLWVKTLLCDAAKRAKQRKEDDAFSLREFLKRLFHRLAVTGEGALDKLSTLGRQLDDAGTAIADVVAAGD